MLKDKIAIVTGSGSGIGKATAKYFAEQGAKVIIAERNAAAGQAAETEITAAGGQAFFHSTDVSQATDVESAVQQAVERFGEHAFQRIEAITVVQQAHEHVLDDVRRHVRRAAVQQCKAVQAAPVAPIQVLECSRIALSDRAQQL